MITELNIGNYKNLINLGIDDIGQINLITGLNNIGKTNLLQYISINNSVLWFEKNSLDINKNLMNIIDNDFNSSISNQIILIDDIETGLHYCLYKPLLKKLFMATIENRNQLFITTHSKEMAQAFCEIAFELFCIKHLEDENEWNCKVRHIELATNIKTKKLLGLVHDVEMLNYKLARGREFRGE